MWWAQTAGDMLGRLGGNLSDSYGTGAKLREIKRQEEIGDRLELERRSIQARVEGAKAAGLHPLVGMGFQGQAGAVQSVDSPSYFSGGPYADPPAPAPAQKEEVDPSIARYNEARARLAETQADQAFLDYQASLFKLGSQPGQGKAVVLPTSDENLVQGRTKPGVKIVPDEVTAGTGGMTAGLHPGASGVEVPGFGRMTVPSGKLKEALEDNELMGSVMLALLNRHRISNYFLEDIPAAVFGVPSMDRHSKRDRAFNEFRRGGRIRGGGATGSW